MTMTTTLFRLDYGGKFEREITRNLSNHFQNFNSILALSPTLAGAQTT
jgi:hypothetical protein